MILSRLRDCRSCFALFLLVSTQPVSSQQDPTPLHYRIEVRDAPEVVHFQPGTTIPSPDSDAVLGEVTEVLAQHPNWKLRIEGYSDDIDNHKNNDKNATAIARLRADAVAQTLVQRYRLSQERLMVVGFGVTRSMVDNINLGGRVQNGSVELIAVPDENLSRRNIKRIPSSNQSFTSAPLRKVAGDNRTGKLWKAVRRGSSAASVVLADTYIRGLGVTQNCEQARILLDAESKNGNPDTIPMWQLFNQRCGNGN